MNCLPPISFSSCSINYLLFYLISQKPKIVSVVSQAYTINLMDENVLRGNSAILKCHLPSFVTEYVTVTSWIISEEDDDSQEISVDDSSNLGILNISRYPS